MAGYAAFCSELKGGGGAEGGGRSPEPPPAPQVLPLARANVLLETLSPNPVPLLARTPPHPAPTLHHPAPSQITGPLIRIIGDRFPWQIKAAILKTLGLLIRWG